MKQEVYALCLLAIFVIIGCQLQKKPQFTSLPSSKTGVTFNNTIADNDTFNILNYEYIYNGGGVALGDINGDDLLDIVFTGNMVSNAIYLNQGDLNFRNISDESGILNHERWSTGVTMIDINLDGHLDIYITSSGHDEIDDKSNVLFINQGNAENGIPTFREMAQEYGLADTSNSTMAAFFDYDNDHDLDLIVIANQMRDDRSPSRYRKKVKDGSSNSDDHLYVNVWDEDLGHPVFREVSHDAGILIEGFSLGLNICDINEDGWKDIYITNDYLSNDLLYINNQDGSFTDKADSYFKHTSFSAMGNDIVDLDNDGDSEIVAVDMLPEDNYRRKTMLPPNKYSDHQNNDKFEFQYQFVRNSLQQNNRDAHSTESQPSFVDVAFMSGIGATDWSWAPLIADFNNDGLRDIIVTNGFPKDVTDRDFIDYSTEVRRFASDRLLLHQVPSVKIYNYAFQNKGNLQFQNVTQDWGIDATSFSNGAAIGDLDNDGDLDYVVNNINDEAFIFRNNENSSDKFWLRVKLNGPSTNPFGLGAIIDVYYADEHQRYDLSTVRGYLSSHEAVAHFGLGTTPSVDRVEVKWQGGKISRLNNVQSNQIVEVNYTNATDHTEESRKITGTFFTEISEELGLDFVHLESDFTDYNVQPLLIHKLSQYGPALSVGDVNNDGLEDLFVSGSHFYQGLIYQQTENGSFVKIDVIDYKANVDTIAEELGSLFFDADGDGDNDLYVTHGGYEFEITDNQYTDRLYVNENGRFRVAEDALPSTNLSSICVRAMDYDKDGDLDLFVGARVLPYKYPTPVSSLILRNDSEENEPLFTDVTNELAPDLLEIGMVTDALWTDFNSDGNFDLLLCGEFMPLTFLQNENGVFKNVTTQTGNSEEVGWWNSLTAGDFDRDGDIDYVAGNYGSNLGTHISKKYPLRAYYKDFDANGESDLFTSCYFPDQFGEMQEFPYYGSTDVSKQWNGVRSKFQFHKEFAKVGMQDIFSPEQMDSAYVLAANNLNSSYFENKGNGLFEISALPFEAQKSPIFGMLTDDVNGDGNLDIMMVGNDFSTELLLGRMDAHDGLIAYGNDSGSFEYKSANSTGFFVQKDAKALVKMYNKKRQTMVYLASQNQGELRAFEVDFKQKFINISSNETYALIHFKDGTSRRQEFYYGNGFISQSSRRLTAHTSFEKVEIFDSKGGKREVLLAD